MLDFDLLNADQTRSISGQIIDVYQAAFSQSPFLETLPDFLNFAGRLSYHAHQPGFRCVVARPPGAQAVGFVYGYPGQAGSWFYNVAVRHLSPGQQIEYLGDYFEFAEFALLPAWQGQGAGGRLHDTLMSGIPQRTACLATADLETNALRLYRKRGWVCLARGIELAGTPLRHQLMGKRLAASGEGI
jgi:GNAT superfamily N-acetyltransferase